MHTSEIRRLIGWGCAMVMLSLGAMAQAGFIPPTMTITVGPENGDVRGSDNAAIQRAIDRAGWEAPGVRTVVKILPGTYTMRDSLHLSAPVILRGSGPTTILRKIPQVITTLATPLGLDEIEFRVADPTGLRVGDGITIRYDKNTSAWGNIMRTITALDGDRVRINRPPRDEMAYGRPDRGYGVGAVVQNSFPIIEGQGVRDITIEDLVVDGNLAENKDVYVDGCRNGGIYFYHGKDCEIRRVTIHDFNGDGLSYQTVDNVLVEDVESYGNAGYGLHPGTGALNTIIRRCHSHHNGDIGLWVCWNVRGGRFEDNVLEDNANYGISTGHNDTDNLFLRNVIRRNGKAGVVYRNDGPLSDRCVFRENRIEDNGRPGAPGVGFEMRYPAKDTLLVGNTIRDTRPAAERTQLTAVQAHPQAVAFTMTDNVIEGKVSTPAQVDAANAMWVWKLDGLLTEMPLMLYATRVEGQFVAAVGSTPGPKRWNGAAHLADLSGLTWANGKVTGTLKLTLLPDATMPPAGAPMQIAVTLDAAFDGRSVKGQYRMAGTPSSPVPGLSPAGAGTITAYPEPAQPVDWRQAVYTLPLVRVPGVPDGRVTVEVTVANGTVTAARAGLADRDGKVAAWTDAAETRITAGVGGLSGTCQVTVGGATLALELTAQRANTMLGGSAQVRADGQPAVTCPFRGSVAGR